MGTTHSSPHPDAQAAEVLRLAAEPSAPASVEPFVPWLLLFQRLRRVGLPVAAAVQVSNNSHPLPRARVEAFATWLDEYVRREPQHHPGPDHHLPTPTTTLPTRAAGTAVVRPILSGADLRGHFPALFRFTAPADSARRQTRPGHAEGVVASKHLPSDFGGDVLSSRRPAAGALASTRAREEAGVSVGVALGPPAGPEKLGVKAEAFLRDGPCAFPTWTWVHIVIILFDCTLVLVQPEFNVQHLCECVITYVIWLWLGNLKGLHTRLLRGAFTYTALAMFTYVKKKKGKELREYPW